MSSINTYFNMQSKLGEKGTYESRRTQVTRVRDKIPGICNEHRDDVNTQIDKVKRYLSVGVKGLTIDGSDVISEYCELLDTYKEKDSYSDSKLIEATNYLNYEISDCTSKIDELNSEISNLQSRYENEKAAEREAARRAAEAARRRAEEAAAEARRRAAEAAQDAYTSSKNRFGSWF